MGCDKYTVAGYVHGSNGDWKDGTIHFSEGGSDMTCLCTLPQQSRLDLEDVRSMAYLGAAVVLQHHGYQDYWHLPGSLPQWMRDDIDRAIYPRHDAAPNRNSTKEK